MGYRQVLDGLRAELLEVCEQIQASHHRLADENVSRPPGESELRMLWERRDALVNRIGAVAAEHLMLGKTIRHASATEQPQVSAETVTPVRRRAAPPPAVPAETVVRVSRRRVVRPAEPVEPSPDRALLAEFVAELGMPDHTRNLDAFLETYERMRYIATHCNRWLDVPTKAQRHLVGAVVSWMRDLQEANDEFGRPLREPQIVGLISRLSHWSRENRPGWVNGLARGASPDGGSWRQDTLYHIEALQGMLTPARASSVDPLERLRHALDNNDPSFGTYLVAALDAGLSQADPALAELFLTRPELLTGTPYQTLLRRVYDRLDLDLPEDLRQESDTMEFVPIGWDWMGYTQGRHVLILGGEPSAAAAAALKDAFEFSKVTWDPADATREGPIVRRIGNGTVDLVLFLESHAGASLARPVDDACTDADVSLVLVPDAYGVGGVRQAIEDDLTPFAEDDVMLQDQPRV